MKTNSILFYLGGWPILIPYLTRCASCRTSSPTPGPSRSGSGNITQFPAPIARAKESWVSRSCRVGGGADELGRIGVRAAPQPTIFRSTEWWVAGRVGGWAERGCRRPSTHPTILESVSLEHTLGRVRGDGPTNTWPIGLITISILTLRIICFIMN